MVPVDQQLVELLYKPAQWKVPEHESEDYRRSIYLIAKRNLRLPFMEVFDQPALLTSCARRQSSTHAPQALELMNGDLANEPGGCLRGAAAARSRRRPRQQVERAYLLAAGRMPTRERAEAGRRVSQDPAAAANSRWRCST